MIKVHLTSHLHLHHLLFTLIAQQHLIPKPSYQHPMSSITELPTSAPVPTPILNQTLPDFNLKSKVILISAAARGLGLTLAEALLQAGARVYALDHLPEPVCVPLWLYYNGSTTTSNLH